MSQELINVGSAPNDNTGDTLRNAFVKTNSNFTEVYTGLSFNGAKTSLNGALGASGGSYGTAGQDMVSSGPDATPSWRNRVTKSTSTPQNPLEGDTWLDTSSGVWSMYFTAGDGVTSSGWVEVGRP
jgi:hypothetical protein